MIKPIISIITITLNSELYLEKTITSVTNQSYENLEYIIIDGGSTDGTLDIIKKYGSNIDHWVSEPDDGIADAMNKGLEIANGDYILFLHSDDYLLEYNSLEKASQFLDNKHDIFLFKLYFSQNKQKTLANPRILDWLMNFKTGILHQATLSSMNTFKRIGQFDTNLLIAMDYDFFLRAYRAGITTKIVDMPLAVMRKTGISSQIDWPTVSKRLHEERSIHEKNCSNLILRFIYFFYWHAYPVYKKFQLKKNKAKS